MDVPEPKPGLTLSDTLPVFERCVSYFTHRRLEPQLPADPQIAQEF
jgi:hypothetical protein